MKKALSSPSSRIAKSWLERRRRYVVSLTESLPEASTIRAGDRHLSLEVRGSASATSSMTITATAEWL
jgi:hypothetical protein